MFVAITGHRPDKLGGYREPNQTCSAVKALLRETLRNGIEGENIDAVMLGMAQGVDQWMAEVCIEEGIPFDAAIPFIGFEKKWPETAQRRFFSILTQSRNTYVVTQTDEYQPSLLYRRNAYMVNGTQALLAVWNGSEGGTANTVRYAQQVGKRVIRLDLGNDAWALANTTYEVLQRSRGLRAGPLGALRPPRSIGERVWDTEELIRARMQSFIGRRDDAETRMQMAQSVEFIRNQIELMNLPIAEVGADYSPEPDRTVIGSIETKEQHEPVPHFKPGRKIDLGD